MDWEAHNIEIVPRDPSNQTATSALYTVAAGLVHRLMSLDIALQDEA